MSAHLGVRIRCDRTACSRWIAANTNRVDVARMHAAALGWSTRPNARGALDLCPAHTKRGAK